MRYLFVTLLIALIGCSKSERQIASDNSIIGKWIQTEYLADPGYRSATWQPDNTGNSYIIFNEDSSAESSGIPYFGELQKYHILSDSTLTLEYANGVMFPRLYKIEDNTLTLMGGCIEACGSKYRKAPTM
jgi:hypothetical protein